MSAEVWQSIAIQIPVVLLFCLFMAYIVKMFLDHLKQVEDRSQLFIAAQRTANNEATRDLATTNASAVKELATTNAQAVRDLATTNATAVRDLATEHRATMERLTDSLCKEITSIGDMLSEIKTGNVGHDTYVRTAFKERFGLTVMSTAEQAATQAEAQAQREVRR